MNFVVHPDMGVGQETDADVVGVRFPFRAEGPPAHPMADDERLMAVYSNCTASAKSPYVIIGEVTKKPCKLNGPWTKRERGNMHRVLSSLGALAPSELDEAARALYDRGVYSSPAIYVSLCCLGVRQSSPLARKYPEVPQIEWAHVAGFIYKRFNTYRETKSSHPQWDEFGQFLWDLSVTTQSPDVFKQTITNAIGVWGQCSMQCDRKKLSPCVRAPRKQ